MESGGTDVGPFGISLEARSPPDVGGLLSFQPHRYPYVFAVGVLINTGMFPCVICRFHVIAVNCKQ